MGGWLTLKYTRGKPSGPHGCRPWIRWGTMASGSYAWDSTEMSAANANANAAHRSPARTATRQELQNTRADTYTLNKQLRAGMRTKRKETALARQEERKMQAKLQVCQAMGADACMHGREGGRAFFKFIVCCPSGFWPAVHLAASRLWNRQGRETFPIHDPNTLCRSPSLSCPRPRAT
jgi:hypothetical protein